MIFNTLKKRRKKKKNVKVGPSLLKEKMFDIGKNGKKNNNRKTMQSSSTCKNITVCTNNCVY